MPRNLAEPDVAESDPNRLGFQAHLETLRVNYNEFDQLCTRISELSLKSEVVTSGKEFRALYDEYCGYVHRSNQLIKLIKSQIDAVHVSNSDFEARYIEGRESEVSMRRGALQGFSNRLRSSLVGFNKAQSEFNEQYTRRTSACGFNRDLSPSPDTSPAGKVGQAFAQAYADTETIRKEDMLRVEKSLMEIRDAFVQIGALVESQGEMLDCIEFSIVNAKNYAHQANKELIQARKKQKQRTWLMVCIVFFVVLLIVLLVVFLKK